MEQITQFFLEGESRNLTQLSKLQHVHGSICFDFFFWSYNHNIYIFIVTRLFNIKTTLRKALFQRYCPTLYNWNWLGLILGARLRETRSEF